MSTSPLSFLRARGTRIVNEAGDDLLLRGMNLGNWFLPEGYMWRFPHSLSSHRRMQKLFVELIGEEKAESFWQTYYDRYIAEADIQRIADEGYNHIRLPLNHRLFLGADGQWIEPMLERIDRLLDWCEAAGLYVMLDLHAAPGGQTGTNIDDSEGYPNLFTDPENAEQTVRFWRGLAERVADRAVVGGYDLLNEPLPREHKQYNGQLVELYKRLIAAIREVDARHLIIVECAHWATDHRIFTEKLDDNLVIQFHKYWCPTDYRFVRDYLNIRETLNVPLWMGESGENSHDWYAASFQMLEDYGISWCFWPWKKLDATNNPCSIRKPEGWDRIGQHAKGEINLDAAEAEAILNGFLENVRLENCEYRPDVVRAMMRRAPFRIPAEAYGLKGVGRSYWFTDRVTTSLNLRREEGANLKFVIPRDDELPAFNYPGQAHVPEEQAVCLTVQAGDWMKYEVNAAESLELPITARLCGRSDDAELELWLDDETTLTGGPVPVDAAWHLQTLAEAAALPAGRHELKVVVTRGTLSLNWIELETSE